MTQILWAPGSYLPEHWLLGSLLLYKEGRGWNHCTYQGGLGVQWKGYPGSVASLPWSQLISLGLHFPIIAMTITVWAPDFVPMVLHCPQELHEAISTLPPIGLQAWWFRDPEKPYYLHSLCPASHHSRGEWEDSSVVFFLPDPSLPPRILSKKILPGRKTVVLGILPRKMPTWKGFISLWGSGL